MQRYYHCCGGNNFLTGYNDYRSTPIGQNFSVPDSCCHQPSFGCGNNIFKQSDHQIVNTIFVHGCLTLLQVISSVPIGPILTAFISYY